MEQFPAKRPSALKPTLLQEQKLLSKEEKRVLRIIWQRKLVIIGSTYICFVLLLFFAWVYSGARSYRFGEDEVARYQYVSLILIGFFFIVLTIFFIRYYLKVAHTFRRDLQHGIKELVYFEPVGYKTPFFDTYYIRNIPGRKKNVRVNKQFFESIVPGCQACVGITPHAQFVFSIEVGGQEMYFNEKNSIMEL